MILNSNQKYNSDLLKGTGLIQETLLLINIYEPSMTKSQMIRNATESNILVKASDMRIKDIVEIVFYKRFVKEDPQVPVYLKNLFTHYSTLDIIAQLFLIYTARSNKIFSDFIFLVYWPEVVKGKLEMDSSFALKFFEETIRHTELINNWSESTKKRVARHIIATMVDFKLLDRQKKINSVFLHDVPANYLAHELHFKGFTDNAIVNSDDWRLFGYSKFDTIKHLERLSFQGHFILQNSGEIVKIDWIYKTMEEFINAIK
ncbi:MAG: BrxA family protein [Bacteroidota bacterium]